MLAVFVLERSYSRAIMPFKIFRKLLVIYFCGFTAVNRIRSNIVGILGFYWGSRLSLAKEVSWHSEEVMILGSAFIVKVCGSRMWTI